MTLNWVVDVQNEAFYRTGIFGNFFFGGEEFCVFEKGIPGGPAVEVVTKPHMLNSSDVDVIECVFRIIQSAIKTTKMVANWINY